MLIKTKDSKGIDMIAIASHPVHDMEDLENFRDCLMHTLELIVSNPETKDSSDSYHLYMLTNFIREITKDLDNYKEQKGCEI